MRSLWTAGMFQAPSSPLDLWAPLLLCWDGRKGLIDGVWQQWNEWNQLIDSLAEEWVDVGSDHKKRVCVCGWRFCRGLCARVLGGGNVCMRVYGWEIKQLSPFMCVKCVCVCVWVGRSEGISIGCERGKGSCLWPDLAQREGVSYIVQLCLYCVYCAFMWIIVISL